MLLLSSLSSDNKIKTEFKLNISCYVSAKSCYILNHKLFFSSLATDHERKSNFVDVFKSVNERLK
jgi:hypothetical protein